MLTYCMFHIKIKFRNKQDKISWMWYLENGLKGLIIYWRQNFTFIVFTLKNIHYVIRNTKR